MNKLIPLERIENKIYLARNQKVMLDRDIAALYEVETKQLKQAVRRNLERFPADFMFELTKEEFKNWRSQIVTSNSDKMGLRWRPFAFTEQGAAMLSSVLRSRKAIQANILIMRAFVKLNQVLTTHKDVSRKIKELEQKYGKHDTEIQTIFAAIKRLMTAPKKPKRKIGFLADKN